MTSLFAKCHDKAVVAIGKTFHADSNELPILWVAAAQVVNKSAKAVPFFAVNIDTTSDEQKVRDLFCKYRPKAIWRDD